jgi:LAO/AO transport system kinase
MTSRIAKAIIEGNPRLIAKGISTVERGGEAAYELLGEIYGVGKSYILGITGPAGAGKSSLINALIPYLKNNFERIGILAVDPSSPFTGGAILGDRIRMIEHAVDSRIFIRSMASRGHLGGVSAATKDAAKILEAAGFDLIIIETVGVGQDEVEVVGLSDTVVLIQVPGLGDDIQVMKSGIMEIGDVFVINKADREGADRIARYIQSMLEENFSGLGYIPPVVLAQAVNDIGLDTIVEKIIAHRAYIEKSGEIEKRITKRIEDDIESILRFRVESFLKSRLDFDSRLPIWVERIRKGEETPFTLAKKLGGEILPNLMEN